MFKNVNQASNPNTQIVRVPWRLREAESRALELAPRPDIILYQADGTLTLREEGPVQQEEIVTRALPDGRMVDLVRDPRDPDRFQLAVRNPDGMVVYSDDLVFSNTRLKPARRGGYILSKVVLPSGVLPYESASKLAREIREIIRSCVEVPRPYDSLLAAFALYTWIADGLPIAVYVFITGLPASGKTTLLQVMRLVCYHSLLTADATPAGISHVCALVSPTLMMDEAELDRRGSSRALARLARAGSNRDQLIIRRGLYTDAFGPKIFCSENPPDDPALESRCIVIPMMAQDKPGLKRPTDLGIVARSQELQNRLLRFRLDRRQGIDLADVPDANLSLSTRRRDLLSALAAPFETGSEWPDLLLQCFTSTEKAKPSLAPDKAAVLDGLWDVCHRSADYFVYTRSLLARIREIYKGEDQKMPLSPEAVGKIMRNNFGFSQPIHTNSGNGFLLHDPARRRIHGLVAKYGLQLQPDPSIANAKESCRFCKELEAASSPADVNDEMLKDLEELDSEGPPKRRRLFDDLQDVPGVNVGPTSNRRSEAGQDEASPPSPPPKTPRKASKRRTRKPRVKATGPGKRKLRVREPRRRSHAVIKGSASAAKRSSRRSR